MTSPDDRHRSMRSAALGALHMFEAAPKFEVAVEHRFVFQPIYPLAAHTMEQVRAALALIDAGLAYPAEVNARSALQHAVTAQWVLFTAAGERRALDEMRRNHSATVRDMAKGVDVADELLDYADASPRSQGPARRFYQMCERFSEDNMLYVLFRRLSDSVHPSLRTLRHHVEADDARGVFGMRANSPTEPETDLMMAVGFSAMFALSAVEYLRRGQTRMPQVRALGAKWKVPIDLGPEDRDRGLRRSGLP